MLPVVDVLMPVYNHERYIAQSIEGIVSQHVNFKFRLIIGEDKSPDGSRAIIEKYAAQYPDIIYPTYHEINLGATGNGKFLFAAAKAKYIAVCEGDDYWIDPTKLQRQFDFMEANPDFAVCFTKVDCINDHGEKIEGLFPEITKDVFTIEDVVMADMVFMPSATLFYRNILPNPMPRFYVNAMSGDIAIHLLLTDKGKAKSLPGITAVYRDHAGGITKTEEAITRGYRKLFELYEQANEYFEYRHDAVIKKRLSEMAKVRLIFGSNGKKGMKKLKYVMNNAPDYFKYSDTLSAKEAAYYFTVLFFPSLLKKKV